jgi:hypothetical protein
MSAKYKMTILQGSTFERVITWKNSSGVVTPLDGMTARFTVRARTFDGSLALNLTTENGGITINTTTDKMTIKATPAQTSAMPIDDYLYILEIKDLVGNEYRLLYGDVKFIGEVINV